MKRYLITGATSGIGQSLVESFSLQEDVELILPVRDIDKATNIYKENNSLFSRIKLVKIDLNEISQIKNALTPILDLSFDGFVHCAGMVDIKNLKRTSYDRFLKVMNVNLFSFVEILRLLIEKKPKELQFRVVAMSSVASFKGDKSNQMYCASKAALDSFIRSISLELINSNVEINSIQSLFVDTPMCDDQRAFHGDNFDNWIKGSQPLGLISTDEIVELIRFFLEKKGKKMTGISTCINAGCPC